MRRLLLISLFVPLLLQAADGPRNGPRLGVGMATSTAGLRTQNRLGVGVGFQGGQTAMSIGYQRARSDRATVTLGGAFSGDDTSVGVGAGIGW